MQLQYLRIVGITAGTIHSTIGIDHITIGVGHGIGAGITHIIGVGGILIITILTIITTIDLRITTIHHTTVA